MEDCGPDSKASISAFFRHRSPTFSKTEIKALLTLVEKYKAIILNKSTNSAANHAKDATWLKIAKRFNSQGFRHVRNAESLKMKWENLKRELRKLTNNMKDVRREELDEVYNQVFDMITEAEKNPTDISQLKPPDSPDEFNDTKRTNESNSNSTYWNSNDKDSEESIDGDNNENTNENDRLLNSSIGFSTQECNLLLQCVRQEKDIVFSNVNTNSISQHRIKNRAWKRIAHSYNRLSPQKRTAQALRKKFQNMKTMASVVNFRKCVSTFGKKYKTEDSSKKIKAEPSHRIMDDDDDDDDDNSDVVNNKKNAEYKSNYTLDVSFDPLDGVQNDTPALSDTEQTENPEVVKLKMELINHQMETAKLERQRIESLMQADAAEREAKALETSFRLRAARLEAVAAEMKIPPSHPALAYTPDEARLQVYSTHQYNT